MNDFDQTDQLPTAWVIGITSEGTLKVRCPYCDKVHHHGALLGDRVSHCGSPIREKAGSYDLQLSVSLTDRQRTTIERAIAANEAENAHLYTAMRERRARWAAAGR